MEKQKETKQDLRDITDLFDQASLKLCLPLNIAFGVPGSCSLAICDLPSKITSITSTAFYLLKSSQACPDSRGENVEPPLILRNEASE